MEQKNSTTNDVLVTPENRKRFDAYVESLTMDTKRKVGETAIRSDNDTPQTNTSMNDITVLEDCAEE